MKGRLGIAFKFRDERKLGKVICDWLVSPADKRVTKAREKVAQVQSKCRCLAVDHSTVCDWFKTKGMLHDFNKALLLFREENNKKCNEEVVILVCHECWTKKQSESPTGVEPLTFSFSHICSYRGTFELS